MGTSAYTIMMPDELAQKLDQLAQDRGEDRSDTIVQILDGYFAERMPRQKNTELAAYLNASLSGSEFKVQYKAADSAIFMKSSVRHEFRPELRISVTFADAPDRIGTLRLALRANEIDMLQRFQEFFQNWQEVEQYYLRDRINTDRIIYSLEEGLFTRSLMEPRGGEETSGDVVGKAIGEYLNAIDTALKLYLGDSGANRAEIERLYRNFIRFGIIF